MDNERTELQKLARRIGSLERQNRFWKAGGLLAIVLLILSVAAGLRAQEVATQAPYTARTLEAQRFVLKSSDGEWSATPGGGALALL